MDLTGARWRKSTRSGTNGNCVEVAGNLAAEPAGIVGVRDGKDPYGPALVFAPAAWTGFLAALRQGRLG